MPLVNNRSKSHFIAIDVVILTNIDVLTVSSFWARSDHVMLLMDVLIAFVIVAFSEGSLCHYRTCKQFPWPQE